MERAPGEGSTRGGLTGAIPPGRGGIRYADPRMSERLRAGHSPTESLSAEDIRRRLEGRAEVLEAARSRAAALESALASRRWKRRLRARPDLVPAWREHTPAVAEALERVRRRAQVEGWPEDTPVLVDVRALVAGQKRLVALARRRLASLTRVSGEPSLEEDLPRLDALLRQRASFSLGPGEVLVFEGQRKAEAPVPVPRLGWALVLVTLVLMGSAVFIDKVLGVGQEWVLPLMVLGAVPWLVVALRSGRVRLTSERLLWEPFLGEPVAVPLDSIPAGGVQLDPALLDVRVEGERRVHLRHMGDAGQLAVLLELHRQPPIRGAARAGVRLADVAIYPVVLHGGLGTPVRGHAVLRPHGVSFIPEGRGAQALQAVTGKPARPPVEARHVLEELRWLPDTEFDECVARVVEATGGLRWSAWDAAHLAGTPVWKEVRISRGLLSLTGQVDWSRQEATERVLRDWPRVAPGRDGA